MTNIQADGGRWQNYVLEHGAGLNQFLEFHLRERERNVLFVLGKGFDPRMCLGIEALLNAGGDGKRDVLAIAFEEGELSPSVAYIERVRRNWSNLQGILKGKGDLSEHHIKMWSEDRRRIGSRSAANIFNNLSEVAKYTDIVIDISALPRNVYLPLIGKVLYLLDDPLNDTIEPKPNLFVFVSEDPVLDASIRDEEVDEAAGFIHGFGGRLEMEATAGRPKVWIPLLGEDQKTQLNRIYDLVIPDEISPVLPSPSLNPRRGDGLVLEYQALLFDLLRVEPRNFIYASERNPFEVYRQIRRTVLHYIEALRPLGGCKTILSAISSKLMSVGALLVAYELMQSKIEIGIAHVESHGYRIISDSDESIPQTQSELFGLWLSGECYEH
jgi:hypothetical protein